MEKKMKKNVRYSFWAIFNNKQQRQLENLKKKNKQ